MDGLAMGSGPGLCEEGYVHTGALWLSSILVEFVGEVVRAHLCR